MVLKRCDEDSQHVFTSSETAFWRQTFWTNFPVFVDAGKQSEARAQTQGHKAQTTNDEKGKVRTYQLQTITLIAAAAAAEYR